MTLTMPAVVFSRSISFESSINLLQCGTTWTQHIVYLILNNGLPLPPDQRLDVVFPHLEEVGKEFIEAKGTILGGYRLIKTHLPYSLVSKNPNAKYIFVTRNPKDCVVSFYHHTVGFEVRLFLANLVHIQILLVGS